MKEVITLILFFISLGVYAVVNVKDFGARGDGVTDDWKSIQKAVDYAVANNLEEVFLPVGTYLIKETLVIDGSNLKLRGEDRSKTKLLKTGNPGWWGDLVYVCGKIKGNRYFTDDLTSTYTYQGKTIPSSNIIFENLGFESRTRKNERINNIGIVNSRNITLKNCTFLQSANSNVVIINDTKKYKNQNILIENCSFSNAKTQNVRILSYNTGSTIGNSVVIRNSVFHDTGVSPSKELLEKNVHLWYRAGVGGKNISLQIENCEFDSSGVIHTSVNANGLSIIGSKISGGYVLSNNSKLYRQSRVILKGNRYETKAKREIKGIKYVEQ